MGLIGGVDFISMPTQDLEASMAFYGETLGIPRSVYIEGKPFAEFETGNLTLGVIVPERMGMTLRAEPESRGARRSRTSRRRGRRSRSAASASRARSSTRACATWRSSRTPAGTG